MVNIKKYLFVLFVMALCACLGTFFLFSQEDQEELAVPPHLRAARVLLENVQPERNSYAHRPSIVRFKGEEGAKDYVCHTDCSGLIDALIHNSYGYTPQEFR